MALLDSLPSLYSTPELYKNVLTPQEQAALEKRASLGGLLGFAGALAQGMSPQGYRRSAAENILTALGAGFGGASQTFQSGIGQMVELQKFQQTQRELARQQQARDAIEAVVKTPEVANNPALVAYFRANPDKALERFVAIQETQAARGITPNTVPTPNVAPVSSTTEEMPSVISQVMANARQRADQMLPMSRAPEGFLPEQPQTEKLAPVSVVAAPSRYAQQLKEAEAANTYFSRIGNTERAKAAREEADNLRNLIRQEELAGSVRTSLQNVHPMLQGMVDALDQNAISMTPAEIQSAISDIRKQDATFRLNSETELRKEFAQQPIVKQLTEVESAYKTISNALSNPSAANDLAAATKFMKLLDPGSVVRESEFGMAVAATGAFDRIGNYFQQLQSGMRLNEAQRADFKKAADLVYQAAKQTYDQTANQYRDLANNYNLNPNNVVLPQGKSAPLPTSTRPAGVGKDWRLSQDAQGNRAWVSPDGTKAVEVK